MTGTELRERRRALGLTQEALADRLGVSRVTLAKWETDTLRIEHAAMLALALDALSQERAARQETSA